MVMTNFLQKRKSVRDFRKDVVSLNNMEEIKKICKNITADFETVEFTILENGSIVSKGLEGKAGYAGVMIDSPHYIALKMKNDDDYTLLNAGYCLEKLNTNLINMDIDTCWITADKVDDETLNSIFGEDGYTIKYLIAFGYSKSKKMFEPEVTSSRLDLVKIVFMNELGRKVDMEVLENRGLLEIFSSIRFAPSHKNSQNWRFVVNDSDITLYMVKSNEDKRSLVDMGVIMYYLEEMMKTMNMYGKWTVSMEDLDEFVKIGKFTI
ncbi:MAG: nitroreductase family protein [Peptoniphilaceae bacterium]